MHLLRHTVGFAMEFGTLWGVDYSTATSPKLISISQNSGMMWSQINTIAFSGTELFINGAHVRDISKPRNLILLGHPPDRSPSNAAGTGTYVNVTDPDSTVQQPSEALGNLVLASPWQNEGPPTTTDRNRTCYCGLLADQWRCQITGSRRVAGSELHRITDQIVLPG